MMKRFLATSALVGLLAFPAGAQIVTGNTGSGGGGSGTVTSITAGNGINLTTNPCIATCTIATTVTNNAQTGATYAVLSTDGGKVVSASNSSSEAYSIAAANTAGFTSGFGFDLNNIGAGVTTLTATTSLFDNGLTTLPLVQGQDAYIYSDGANYHSILSLPTMAADTLLGNFTGTAGQYPVAGALTSCSTASSAVTYNTTTHAFGCNSISGSGTVNSGTAGNGAYYATTAAAVSDAGSAQVSFGGVNVTSGTVVVNGIALKTTNTPGLFASSVSRFDCSSTICTAEATSIVSSSSSGFQLSTGNTSATGPTLVPNKAASTTGWGAQANGVISGIIVAVERFRFTNEGLIFIQATAPAVTGTGTPTIAAGSSDTAGEATTGTTATSLIITFNLTHTNAPFCVVTPQTQLVAFAFTISNTAITITQTATSGNKIDYHCDFH